MKYTQYKQIVKSEDKLAKLVESLVELGYNESDFTLSFVPTAIGTQIKLIVDVTEYENW